MRPEFGRAVLHVGAACCLCVATVSAGVFDAVFTEVGYEHYAETPVAGLPSFLAMPFNSLVNIGYLLLGWYWLHKNTKAPGNKEEGPRARYLKDVFATMALAYGPVQWVRIWTQTHRSAILDQWFTLPIFAWPIAWCRFVEEGWKPQTFFLIECVSLSSYCLALLHRQGFELALGCHILLAVWHAWRAQQCHGNAYSASSMTLAVLSCLGFVVLKLGDHWLSQWLLFRQMTGHFWSKVCDVLQFHFAFLFLTNLNNSPQRKKL
ncbi:transmembrane protein 187 [Ornithorhynchus anatinus]|uniref:Transmembrane protein 187 n=1 Tax=Ornithorhynchus anatinus TaxID=9258 RepID=A0A6I8PHE6_ORNAN|nr:transmembrane protein 187 [Ornithorhynchus anatinus]XP_028923271.1 transmembrane protein 187 [Ornithorhynchus anatinus]